VPVTHDSKYRGPVSPSLDNDTVFALIAIERRRVADLFEGLDEAQWATRSLCSQWSVRDLAGHLTAPFCLSIPRFLLGSLVSGGFNRYNERVSRRLGQRPAASIVATLRDNAETRFSPPGAGPLAPLTDLAVHARDAARPLGLDTCAPLDTWRIALDFLTSKKAKGGFVPGRSLDGLRLTSTDQDWSFGQGLEVSGPSEALALAVTGRSVALDALTGDGLSTLRARLN
jgi:uncharacterized protein (TIGR03083 family)